MLLPAPGCPPIRMLEPGTKPPPRTRSSSSNPESAGADRPPQHPQDAAQRPLHRRNLTDLLREPYLTSSQVRSSEFPSTCSRRGTHCTVPATWGNRPHSHCRQMRFLPSPRETLRKLSVIAVLVQVSRYPIRPLDPLRIKMPSASLIPDRQLTFSPELAETIGLEEAVLLQALG